MRRYATIVAVDEYSSFSPTPCCHADASLLRDTLLKDMDYSEQDVVTMLLKPGDGTVPSRIIENLSELVKRSDEGDTLLFFFAGHGDVHEGEPYLILPDTDRHNKSTSALPLRDISHLLRENGRLNVRFFDACHSGFDVRSPQGTVLQSSDFTRAVLSEQADSWVTFAACREDEYSHSDPSIGHGVFTRALCDSLSSFDYGTGIHPELLKIDVCERVAQWARANKLRQTPTMNASISGNVHIARRMQLEPTENEERASDSAERREDSTLAERLASLRGIPARGTDEHLEQLEQSGQAMLEETKARIEGFNSFGAKTVLEGPDEIWNLPDEFEADIYQLVTKLKVKPVHEVSRWREEVGEERFAPIQIPSLATLAGFAPRPKPKVMKLRHRVEQPYRWPPCYVHLQVQSDGTIPPAVLFFYLMPLQLRCLLVAGIGTSDLRVGEDTVYKRRHLHHQFITPGTEDERTELRSFVDRAFSDFQSRFRTAVEEQVRYFEYELHQ